MTNHSCIGCGREIVDGTKFQICENCLKLIERLNLPVCEKCGEVVNFENKICDYCKNSNYAFDENRSYCYYSDVSAKIVKGLKYGRKKYFAKHIAEMMTELTAVFNEVDVITFVPINKKRKTERGFNQAEEIAKEISAITKLPVVEVLTKDDNAKHQTGLSQKERFKNLKDSFLINDDAKSYVKGKVVLVVDDVFTTGATLSECAKTIKKLKPNKIKTITFAKTKYEH